MAVEHDWPHLLTLIPGYDPFRGADDFYFDEVEANDRVAFIECLKHVKGAKGGKQFILEDWQKGVIGCLFGWKRKRLDTRRYRRCLLYVARKNGKTPLAAAILLSAMLQDREPGAELYGAASEYKQACLLFDQVRGMIQQDDMWDKNGGPLQIFDGQQKAVTWRKKMTSYQVLTSGGKAKHGQNTHFVVIDELHAIDDREMLDTLETSIGARTQPIILYCTTADYQRISACNSTYKFACDVRDGVLGNKAALSFLPVIFEAEPGDDWTSPGTWRKANPNLGVSVSVEYLEEACAKAQAEPRFENEFKRLHCNIRTSQDVRWIPLSSWDECESEFTEEDMEGRTCYGGLDMASKSDLAAFTLVFPMDVDGKQKYSVLAWFWCPADNLPERDRKDNTEYAHWSDKGHLIATPGERTNHGWIRNEIVELKKRFKIKQIAYDGWNAEQIGQELSERGFEMVDFMQSCRQYNEPSQEFEACVAERRILHNGHPVLRWCVNNVTVRQDPRGNIMPDKAKSTEKIDGVTAMIMALSRAMFHKQTSELYFGVV